MTNLRLLPWAAFALLVAVLAWRTPAPEQAAPPSPAECAAGAGLSGLEVRLGPVDLRESHDDGAWNRLLASSATYSYGRRTVAAAEVVVSLGEDKAPGGAGQTILRAPRAFWDFDGKRMELPEGGRAENEAGWRGELAPADVDLETRVLHVPGAVTLSGPGVSIAGRNLRWGWLDGKIAMDAPASRILPSSLQGRKG